MEKHCRNAEAHRQRAAYHLYCFKREWAAITNTAEKIESYIKHNRFSNQNDINRMASHLDVISTAAREASRSLDDLNDNLLCNID